MGGRPPVDVVIPFGGRDVARAVERAARLERREGDSVTVVDNRGRGAASREGARLVVATEVASSYFARNVGARGGSAEWIVFLDADVVPLPGLLDAYFAATPGGRTAVLAGAVRDAPGGRGTMSQELPLAAGFAQTANCAVRREAFEAVRGFAGDVRSGGDADLCLRLRAAGWELERRDEAAVVHQGRRSVVRFLAQRARHGAGSAWVDERHPGAIPPRSIPGLTWWSARRAASGEPLDGAAVLAYELGRRLMSNRAR